MGDEESSTELPSVGTRERLNSETRAEVAREFRKTLNRSRPSRKRYSLSSAHYSRQQSLEASGKAASVVSTPYSSLERDSNAFLSYSVADAEDGAFGGEGGGLSLGAAVDGGGEAIYREFEEYDSLSRVKNKLKRLIPQPIRKSVLPPRSLREWKAFLCTHLPILHWLWTYTPNLLIGDLIAGITIGVTHIPQGHTCTKGYVVILCYQLYLAPHNSGPIPTPLCILLGINFYMTLWKITPTVAMRHMD